jgi:hypothetical protein
MQPPEMQRLRQLEDENAKLKKIEADLVIWRAWAARRDEVSNKTSPSKPLADCYSSHF